MSNTVLSVRDVAKSYGKGHTRLDVCKDISLDVYPGEIVALVGPSGCGKSTLLHVAGLLDRQDSGSVIINDVDCTKASDRKRTKVRLHDIGFIYQFHHLLPEFSALENVVLPQMIARVSKKKASERAMELLESLGLKERATHRPAELSGGEQQRVAIARALANNPSVLLADEPTGNLDPDTASVVFDILLKQVKEMKLALVFATHDLSLSKKADRAVTFDHGVLVSVTKRGKANGGRKRRKA